MSMIRPIKGSSVAADDAATLSDDIVDSDGNRRWNDEWNVGWIDDGHGARAVSHPLETGYELLDE